MKFATQDLKEQLAKQKEEFEFEIALLKDKLVKERKEKAQMIEQIKDQNYTLNGLFNIERRNETYENLKNQIRELEEHLDASEKHREKTFKVTNEVMSYIHIAGGMIPDSFEKALQTGHSTVPIQTDADLGTLPQSLDKIVTIAASRLFDPPQDPVLDYDTPTKAQGLSPQMSARSARGGQSKRFTSPTKS